MKFVIDSLFCYVLKSFTELPKAYEMNGVSRDVSVYSKSKNELFKMSPTRNGKRMADSDSSMSSRDSYKHSIHREKKRRRSRSRNCTSSVVLAPLYSPLTNGSAGTHVSSASSLVSPLQVSQ
uniref:SYBU n=1 Tax=Heterorhabditis bacteriophora TaxID=37862 RepID=A0A1I7XSZ2_HETBA